ncbi:MAG: hypoxanthine phosphoribosyltransferase [Bacteroidales bacterium]|jgi:hypoxanthine phosphoribosyltransferase|nr:hypoxanthine phosphoribosyltransferase [Bacteroidales bacterium]
MDMDTVTLYDKTFVKYIDASLIGQAVQRIACQIEQDYVHDIPLCLVVLDGAMVFAADLIRRIQIPMEINCVKYASYQGLRSTQQTTEIIGMGKDIAGRRVIIIEDIVDTGLTIDSLREKLAKQQVGDVRTATLTFKKEAYRGKAIIDYIGMEVDNLFIVGYGMDYNQRGRNLPHIYQLKEE